MRSLHIHMEFLAILAYTSAVRVQTLKLIYSITEFTNIFTFILKFCCIVSFCSTCQSYVSIPDELHNFSCFITDNL